MKKIRSQNTFAREGCGIFAREGQWYVYTRETWYVCREGLVRLWERCGTFAREEHGTYVREGCMYYYIVTNLQELLHVLVKGTHRKSNHKEMLHQTTRGSPSHFTKYKVMGPAKTNLVLLNDLTADTLFTQCHITEVFQRRQLEIVTISILEQRLHTGRKHAHTNGCSQSTEVGVATYTVSTHTSCPSIKYTLWQFWPQIRRLHMAHSVAFWHTLAVYLMGTLLVVQ